MHTHTHTAEQRRLTGLVWTVDSSSNLMVAEVMTLMMSSQVLPEEGDQSPLKLT